jgi:hypothetical protein
VHLAGLARTHGPAAIEGLSTAKLRSLIGLPIADQSALLGRARTTTAAELDRAASRLRSRRPRGPGRPAVPDHVRRLRALGRALDQVEGQLSEISRAGLTPAEIAGLRALGNRLQNLGSALFRRALAAEGRR